MHKIKIEYRLYRQFFYQRLFIKERGYVIYLYVVENCYIVYIQIYSIYRYFKKTVLHISCLSSF